MSLVIAQSLSRRGVEVIGCDDVDMTVMSFSRYVDNTFTHPKIEDDEKGYFDTLLEKVIELKPEDDRPYILMPVFRNTRAISKRRDIFSDHITVAAPDWESICKIFPKENLAKTAKTTNANIPKSTHTEDEDELKRELEKFRAPLMLKPVAGVGGKGIEEVKDASAAIKAHQAFLGKHGEAPLIQEKVEGEDYCFTGLFSDGELLAHMAYRNLQSFPVKTGAGAIRETVDDAPFIEAATKLMKPTGWTGVAEIDFMWTGEKADEPFLIEVNPRFWAGLFHSVKSGVDFPWLLYQLFACGDIGRTEEATIGETTKAPALWLASTAQEIAESSTNFERLAAAWRNRAGVGFGKKFSRLTRALGNAVDLNDACFRIFESADLAKNSADELNEHKDPFAGLGILFVLSSLARHGRLPDEVKP
ncbi:MAG: ATP-grasp domain-containing protein [Marinicaulis sp.]|nr:ATP-grasp domain-containing protein [Marinicaulis sp.]